MNLQERLSRIETLWSVVRQAHQADSTEVKSAQERLIDRYSGAVRRYLWGALRNENAVDEVYQEFALRFVRGDFRRADPQRGRFRNFLKTVLFNLVMDHHRRRKKTTKEVPFDEQFAPASEQERRAHEEAFLQTWRDDLLAKTWTALEKMEKSSGRPVFRTMRLKMENADLRSGELAKRLSEQLGKSVSAGNTRVLVHRARESFADLLVEEVAHSLEFATPEAVEEELNELRLMEYCRVAFERRYQE